MQEFLEQLGIDWRLFVSQAVNFLLILILLRVFVYRPLLDMLRERRLKIEEGLTKAAEAARLLSQVETIKKEKIHEAERAALEIVRETETKLKTQEAERLAEATLKAQAVIQNAEASLVGREAVFQESMKHELVGLLTVTLQHLVKLSPEEIDQHLIREAVKHQEMS